MGREVRRVPAGWAHPRDARTGAYRPLFDRDFETTARKWMDNARAWDDGTHPDAAEYKARYPFFWQWDGGPPDPESYRPRWTDAERTHYQVYETVSEGTPVTPAFATKEELVDYLVERGDDWDRQRGTGGWPRKNAEEFVERAWAPSMIIVTGGQGAGMYRPQDGMP